jgi:hypothetical protein
MVVSNARINVSSDVLVDGASLQPWKGQVNTHDRYSWKKVDMVSKGLTNQRPVL